MTKPPCPACDYECMCDRVVSTALLEALRRWRGLPAEGREAVVADLSYMLGAGGVFNGDQAYLIAIALLEAAANG